MTLRERYSQIYMQTLETIERDGFSYDTTIIEPSDDRYGLTLIGRMTSGGLHSEVQGLYGEIGKAAPGSYLYPVADLHITVLSLIECAAGRTFSPDELQEHAALLMEALHDVGPIRVDVTGLIASPTCLMLAGYPEHDQLNHLRDRIRSGYGKHPSISHTIDSRYTQVTAHVTIARFTRPVNDSRRVLDILERYRKHPFGKQVLRTLELVTNDWCLTSGRTKKIAVFPLREDHT